MHFETLLYLVGYQVFPHIGMFMLSLGTGGMYDYLGFGPTYIFLGFFILTFRMISVFTIRNKNRSEKNGKQTIVYSKQ
ncbi:MFS transporter [Vagococcus entomophilus]|uniref:MFS transporter n=1 Tax=Vagococcus entomophilus TaxID=1160095 RepID=UPI0035E5258C